MRVPPPPWHCRMTTTKSCRFVGGRDATVALTGLNRTIVLSKRGGIVSIRSSTEVNCSAAVMSRSGSVDETRRHHRSIARHRIDADFLFHSIPTHPDAPRFYHLAQIGMNRGDSWPES